MWKKLFGTRSETWMAAGLLLRLTLGVIFVYHGWGKVMDLRAFIGKVEGMGIAYPQLLGPAAALSELLGGACLILGIVTRFWALMLACVMAVAVFKIHWGEGMFGQGGFEYPLALGMVCIALLMMGPGKWSLDDRL